MTDEEWLSRLGVPALPPWDESTRREPLATTLKRWRSSGLPILVLNGAQAVTSATARDLLVKLNATAKALPRNPNNSRILSAWILSGTVGRISTINPGPPVDLFDAVERKLEVNLLVIEGLGLERGNQLVLQTEVNWMIRRVSNRRPTIITTALGQRELANRWQGSAAGILPHAFWSTIQGATSARPAEQPRGRQESRAASN